MLVLSKKLQLKVDYTIIIKKRRKELIVLGEQHNFSNEELKILEKKFSKLNFIKYNEVDSKKVMNTINSYLTQKENSLIVLNTKALVSKELLSYLITLEQKGIEYISIQSFMEKYLNKCYIPNNFSDINFLEKMKPFNKIELFFKFLIDYTASISLIILTSPIILYSIYKIKKESPGSIIFKQQRIGLKGKEFTCYKFRSMHENSHDDPYTRKNDNRIYPWGDFMRKTRIDELPQLINILKGDMHLIGPRAEWNRLVKDYENQIPYYHQRHIIKPGITGWAQVNYPYGANLYDTKQKLMFDFYYIKNWNLWLEIKSIWKTIMVVLGKKGV